MKKVIIFIGVFIIIYYAWVNGCQYNKNRYTQRNEMVTKTDSCVKTKFTWEDSHGNLFPVYMTNRGSCFVIRTSKSGESYRAFLGNEVSAQISTELKLRE